MAISPHKSTGIAERINELMSVVREVVFLVFIGARDILKCL